MITVRKSDERGHANHGWLDSYHTFSFANYQDPAHMGFRALRVINQDQVQPKEGFGTHSHNDMEIISYVVAGKLSHKDSMGTVATLERGDVQVMSAGTGVTHSEFNGGDRQPVRFLQIWILPDKKGHEPRYQDKRFADETKRDRLRIIASSNGRDGSLPIHQDAAVFASLLAKGRSIDYELLTGRYSWVQVISGDLTITATSEVKLAAGDGARIESEAQVQLVANSDSEFLFFDLA